MENNEKDFFSELKSGVKELGKQVGKVFNDAFSGDNAADMQIRTDVYATKEFLVFELELAGVPKEVVSIQIVENTLVVKGKKTRPEGITADNYVRSSRIFGEFQKSFDLPNDVSVQAGIKAKFENGLLTVRIPRVEVEEDLTKSVPIE